MAADEDTTHPLADPDRLCREVQFLEDALRTLHKRLRYTGAHEASWALLAAADQALAAARALAPEMPPVYPRNVPRELFLAG